MLPQTVIDQFIEDTKIIKDRFLWNLPKILLAIYTPKTKSGIIAVSNKTRWDIVKQIEGLNKKIPDQYRADLWYDYKKKILYNYKIGSRIVMCTTGPASLSSAVNPYMLLLHDVDMTKNNWKSIYEKVSRFRDRGTIVYENGKY